MKQTDSTARLDAPQFGRAWLVGAWLVIVLLFATQWYAYDESRGTANPYSFYVGWSCLMWVLAPLVIWFSARYPLRPNAWRRWAGMHVAASLVLSCAQVLGEAAVKWGRIPDELPFRALAAHYFLQHFQLYVLTYWVVLAATEVFRIHERARQRQLRSAELERQLSEARLEALRMQLRPHFLFNTLQAALSMLRHNPEAVEGILLNLSALLRASLTGFQTNEVPLQKELEFLTSYLGIQQQRFGERLCVSLCVDERTRELAVPSLILQPLVENAIKHGIGDHKGSDVVTVRTFVSNDGLTLEVRNGSSTLRDGGERLWAQGIGLANTRARLSYLYGKQQSIELLNLEPRGVCVRVVLPPHQAASARDAATSGDET